MAGPCRFISLLRYRLYLRAFDRGDGLMFTLTLTLEVYVFSDAQGVKESVAVELERFGVSGAHLITRRGCNAERFSCQIG